MSQKSDTDPSVVAVSVVSTVRTRTQRRCRILMVQLFNDAKDRPRGSRNVDACGCRFESQTSGYQGSLILMSEDKVMNRKRPGSC